jgi:hypothetical protein
LVINIFIPQFYFKSQSGTSTDARKAKYNEKLKAEGHNIKEREGRRKVPYDFTGCLAHLDITYLPSTLQVRRVTGIVSHNKECQHRLMVRLPAIPLHDHVWQVALQQLNDGARLAFVLQL